MAIDWSEFDNSKSSVGVDWSKFDAPTLPIRESTLAGKVVGGMGDVSPFPISPFKSRTVPEFSSKMSVSANPFMSAPIQTLESLGGRVKQGAIGNILNKPFSDEFIAKHGAFGSVPGQLGATVLDLATPFTPSQFAGSIAAQLPFAHLPLAMRNPESAIARLAESTAGENIPRTVSGKILKDSLGGFGKRMDTLSKKVMKPISDTESRISAIEAERTPSFQAGLKNVSKKLYPAVAHPTRTGQQLVKGQKNILINLRRLEGDAWKNVVSEHPASNNSDAMEYISNLLNEKGFSEVKNLPLEMNKSQDTLNMMAEQGVQPIYGKFVPRNVGTEYKPYAKLQNILVNLKKPELNFNDQKQIRSTLGKDIDWSAPRSNELEYHKKQIYGLLTKDMERTATEGNFLDKTKNAFQRTKDIYKFIEQPSSEIIHGLKQEPSQIVDRLVGTNSPERVNEIMGQYDFKTKKIFQRGFLERLAEKSKGSPDKFSSLLSSYSRETRKAMFGEDQRLVESLNNFSKKLYKVTELKGYEKYLQEAKGRGSTAIEDTLGRKSVSLANMIRETDASELIDNISKGSVEDIQTLNKILDDKGKDILGRGLLSNILETHKIPRPDGKITYNTYGIATDLHKFSDEFINELYGKNADAVKTLRNVTRFSTSQRTGDIFYEAERTIQRHHLGFLPRILKRLMLPNRINRMIGEGFAGRGIRGIESAQETAFPISSRISPFIPFRSPLGITGPNKDRSELDMLAAP